MRPSSAWVSVCQWVRSKSSVVPFQWGLTGGFGTAALDDVTGQRRRVEKLWVEFFADPSQWWDHRLEKGNYKYPDFKHKRTQKSLWIKSKLNPLWVDGKLGAMSPGSVQLNQYFWNKKISRYAKAGRYERALDVFHRMQREGITLDKYAFTPVLTACASLPALAEGRRIHEQIREAGCESDVVVGTRLIDMYAKCGSIEDACQVFEKMPARTLASWNAMLEGLALHGLAMEALQHFELMCREKVGMDGATFVFLLSACRNSRLVDEGLQYFASMKTVHAVPVTLEHFACIVDLYGRAGRLHEAEDVIKAMPCKPNVVVWMCLLGACRIHGSVGVGEWIVKKLLKVEPRDPSSYLLLSNVYSAAGYWDTSANDRQTRMERGMKKEPGCSWTEVDDRVHSFTLEDFRHPRILEIRDELDRMYREIKKSGYVVNTSLVMHDMGDRRKEFQLCQHSERLAIAFGLISTPPGSPLRIYKNLPVCEDCHAAVKVMAKVSGRQIIVRDLHRFHHFEDGYCSCGA